ncbi:hypothetical protein HELRODRAFT_71206, partial [Helobdella robusta]|uniref:Protein kinase domain-containing protein n=1 Tax=Helobdella robusta TaxID=6412 RepID=T1G0H8_HELRO
RNLKLCNVLVDSIGYPRLSDFGRKKSIIKRSDDIVTSLGVPSMEYIAPEVFTSDDSNYMVDLWAFAVCIVYMLTGQV